MNFPVRIISPKHILQVGGLYVFVISLNALSEMAVFLDFDNLGIFIVDNFKEISSFCFKKRARFPSRKIIDFIYFILL